MGLFRVIIRVFTAASAQLSKRQSLLLQKVLLTTILTRMIISYLLSNDMTPGFTPFTHNLMLKCVTGIESKEISLQAVFADQVIYEGWRWSPPRPVIYI